MSDINGREMPGIEDLRTYFFTSDGTVRAVDGVSLEMRPRETLGLVGESGCGKSVTAYSILRLVPSRVARIVEGSIWFRRRGGDLVDLAALDPFGEEMRSIRGNEIAMIFQEPMTAFSPVHTIGNQIAGPSPSTRGLGGQAMERATAPSPRWAWPCRRSASASTPTSWAACQRALIAMALVQPRPAHRGRATTALDDDQANPRPHALLQERHDMAIMMIT